MWCIVLQFFDCLTNWLHHYHQLHKCDCDIHNKISRYFSEIISCFPPIGFHVFSLVCVVSFTPKNCKASIIDYSSYFPIVGSIPNNSNRKKCTPTELMYLKSQRNFRLWTSFFIIKEKVYYKFNHEYYKWLTNRDILIYSNQEINLAYYD